MQPSTDQGNAGFTIIEVLVALALIAVSVIAIQQVMSTNAKGVRTLEQHVALEQMTRAVMSTVIPQRNALKTGETSGETRDYRWAIGIKPLGGEWTVPKDAKVDWQPEMVRIVVRSASGATSDIRTVRLVQRTASQ